MVNGNCVLDFSLERDSYYLYDSEHMKPNEDFSALINGGPMPISSYYDQSNVPQ